MVAESRRCGHAGGIASASSRLLALVALLIGVFGGFARVLALPQGDLDPATQAAIADAYGKLPLGFEAHDGQAPRKAKFLARGSGYNVSLTATEAVIALQQPATATSGNERRIPGDQTLLRMRLVGANQAPPRVEATEELPGKVNYLVGNNASRWRRGIGTYGRVRYYEVYPGVDLAYYGNQRQLEYDFIVAPGIDPSIIALDFEGPSSLSIDADGSLLLHIDDTQARLRKPIVYQEIGGVRRDVVGGFAMRGSNAVGFAVGAYDATHPLVIDPILVYAVSLGSNAGDGGASISVDASGNAYLTGWAVGFNFPTTGGTLQIGSADAFVFKSTDGGSSWGSSSSGITSPNARAIAVDPVNSSNLYVVTFAGVFKSTNGGSTWISSNTGLPGGVSIVAVDPLTPSTLYAGTSTGVFKSTNAGVIWSASSSGMGSIAVATISIDPLTPSTLYAGTPTGVFKSTNAGTTWSASSTGLSSSVLALAIDPVTTSTLYAATGSGFVYKSTSAGDSWTFASNGLSQSPQTLVVDPSTPSLVYAGTNAGVFKTTNGGGVWGTSSTGLTGTTIISGLAIDPVTPSTLYAADSNNGRIFKSTDGASSWSASDAGVGNRTIRALAVDPMNPSTVYAAANFATDAIVVKLDPAGALVYSTYLGGAGFDRGNGVAVDSGGNAYVIGDTQSADFPTVNAFQTTLAGKGDAFVVKLDPTGSALLYSTYLGGACDEDGGSDIAVDPTGDVHVVGAAGFCSPNTFRTTPSGFQPSCSAGNRYLARIDPTQFGSASLAYSTCFVGGSTIAVDLGSTTYVGGSVSSITLPTLSAFQPTGGGSTDGFVARFDTYQAGAASLLYASYLGGSGSDSVFGISVDGSGNAYVGGTTSSTDFPTTLGAFQTAYGGGSSDAFAAKIDPFQVGAASLIYSTYLGANDSDRGLAAAVDAAGNAHIAGAAGTNFPLLDPTQTGGSGFLVKLNAAGSGLAYSTRISRTASDVAVHAGSTDAYLVADNVSGNDIFVARISPITPTPTATATPTATPTSTPTTTSTATNTPSRTLTRTSTTTPTHSPTATPTPTNTPTRTPSDSPTATATETPTASATHSPTRTVTDTPTATPTGTPTDTRTSTTTATAPDTATATPSETPTETAAETSTDTATPTETATETPTASVAHSPTSTVTDTQAETPTDTPTHTPTTTGTVSPTPTPPTATCPATPNGGCLAPTKGMVILRDSANGGKDGFRWTFSRGPALSQGDFGDPTSTTSYALCVYDDGARVMDVQVEPNPMRWSAVSTKGWQYKDLAGGYDGVTKAKLLGGDAGKSKAQAKGKGGNVPLPAPISGTQFLNATASVRVQLHGSNGACYETTFTPAEVLKNDGRQFKAKF